MKKKALLLVAFAAIFCSGMSHAQNPAGGLTIEIRNLRNKTGLVRIGLYFDEKEFTDNPSMNFTLRKDTLSSDHLSITVQAIPPGNYAMSVLDDENGDNKMNYRLVVWPDEGFGFSNNPMIKRPVKPKYSDISFNYDGTPKRVVIDICYF